MGSLKEEKLSVLPKSFRIRILCNFEQKYAFNSIPRTNSFFIYRSKKIMSKNTTEKYKLEEYKFSISRTEC